MSGLSCIDYLPVIFIKTSLVALQEDDVVGYLKSNPVRGQKWRQCGSDNGSPGKFTV